MSTEELIREIVSKMCPFHGKHPTVNIHEAGQMNISTCWEEFHKLVENIIPGRLQNSFDPPAFVSQQH